MKKIVFNANDREILFSNVNPNEPIFAKSMGKLIGMIVHEKAERKDNWILRIGGDAGATGYHNTLEECIKSCYKHGYEFFIE